jgi:hypothetical protein
MTLADRVTARLNRAQVTHATVGAAALAAAGVVRSSLDLDLLTLDARVLEPGFWAELTGGGAAVDVRRGDQDDPLAGVVRVTADGERPVDVIVGRYRWQQRALERAQLLSSGERVVRPRDLVLLKLYAGGKQDLWDIAQLLAVTDRGALIAEVEEDLSDLPPPAAALWHTAKAAVVKDA